MKPATVDMLRAHLMVASFSAMFAEVLACAAILALPVSPATFSTVSFRLLAVAVILSGVVLARQLAQAAFELAVRSGHAIPFQSPLHLSHHPALYGGAASPLGFAIADNCPRREFVILHLRLTGRPFVLATR